ncbi:LytTR family transcriptional regulator DNA-binding domain-containing protein [Sphingomonas astaxanthinifaciens]|uniref:HTH LytTR-type domain-containing protein n=1 Tax=Sphingomonas astaxanthinifaciens DSM 22298 TaxID=1123267 RepID=A0ABQ5Z472_9SPHN|nr:LytTR family transcriptional regulator DNA-binding domain-containing protein [Sphingomonas astaxanthinifaciens]GLR46744.1 hypothetical protein GCM10007925_04550 [Sphingomonas astaxanthinifaciens DSM 22298]
MPELDVVVCLAFDHRAPADGLASFKACIARCQQVKSATEVSGTFDLIVEAHCESLPQYMEEMERLRPMFATYATRVESSFVSRKMERRHEQRDTGLWLPCSDGRRRIEIHRIDKVCAEGDYMRVHVGPWNCLVHQTLAHMAEQLTEPDFLKLNRSCLVRVDFIDRLIHEGRRWRARLSDGTEVRVAQSNVHHVLHATSHESSIPRHDPSKEDELTIFLA